MTPPVPATPSPGPAGPRAEAASERPTRIRVDLDALGHNLRALRAHAGVPVMAVVKANAYGHGLVPVARHLQSLGVEYPVRIVLHIALCMVAMATRNALFHGAFVLAALVYQVSWISRYY